MEPSSSITFSAMADALASSPLIAICAALVVAVVALWRRQTALEKDFRTYAMEQGAKTAALLDRATKAIERIEESMLRGAK